jgi:hypothetical protein
MQFRPRDDGAFCCVMTLLRDELGGLDGLVGLVLPDTGALPAALEQTTKLLGAARAQSSR